jgi:ferric-dicitrate binding protein FerR (iron transport regulator)
MQHDRPMPVAGETVADYRIRVAQHQAEMAARRHQELLEQASPEHAPALRIRIWERLHQVTLPRNPAHRLLDVIAADTGLSVEEVREEQRQRLAPPPAPAS